MLKKNYGAKFAPGTEHLASGQLPAAHRRSAMMIRDYKGL